MINKFGNEIKIVDCRLLDIRHQILEANTRHLQHVRDRFRKYKAYKSQNSERVANNTLMAEQLCLLAKWEQQRSQ